MCGGLLLRGDRFAQGQNLCHDWLDLSRVDQARNLREVCCIRMNRDCRTVNTPLLELGPIGERDQTHDNAAFLHCAIRTGERFFSYGIEHGVHIFGDVFEPGLCIIDCDVCAELLEEVLVCGRGGRDDACPTRFGDLNCETTDTARPAVDQNGLSRLQLRYVHQRLPCSQSAHRYRRGFDKVQRLGFRGHFPFLDRDVICPAATERWITVNRIAHLELGDVCAGFFYDAGDLVAGDEWQMRAEFLCVFTAERERVSWIDSASDYAHECFIVFRLGPRHLFKFQQVRRAILMRDDCLHHRFFFSACAMRKSENRDAQQCEARMTHLDKLSRIERGQTTR